MSGNSISQMTLRGDIEFLLKKWLPDETEKHKLVHLWRKYRQTVQSWSVTVILLYDKKWGGCGSEGRAVVHQMWFSSWSLLSCRSVLGHDTEPQPAPGVTTLSVWVNEKQCISPLCTGKSAIWLQTIYHLKLLYDSVKLLHDAVKLLYDRVQVVGEPGWGENIKRVNELNNTHTPLLLPLIFPLLILPLLIMRTQTAHPSCLHSDP